MRSFFTAALVAPMIAAKVNLIVDSDAGFDVDDMGALAVAHQLADNGECNLIGVMSSTCCNKSIAAMSVVNTYYGRRDLPIGAYKGDFGCNCSSQDLYLDDLVNNYDNNGVWDSGDVDDVQDVYVRVLNEADDNSVTIAAIGFPMNVRNLLRNYHDLFTQKVKAVYWMNGYYNFGCAEHHWLQNNDADCYAAAQEAQIKFPHTTKEYFQINGGDMCTGWGLYHNQCGGNNNPVKEAYQRWLGAVGGDCRPSWDPLTVYAAVRGTDATLMWEENGTDEIDEEGHENWDKSWTTNNEVSLWFLNNNDKDTIKDRIDDLMCHGASNNSFDQFLQ